MATSTIRGTRCVIFILLFFCTSLQGPAVLSNFRFLLSFLSLFVCIVAWGDHPLMEDDGQQKVILKRHDIQDYDWVFRVWRDDSGEFEVLAKFHSFLDDKVRIRRKDNGKLLTLAVKRFSMGDQDLLDRMRTDIETKARNKKQHLDPFKMGILKFINASAVKYKAMVASGANGSLTTIQRKELQYSRWIAFRDEMDGQEFMWHVSVVDVLAVKGERVKMSVRDAFLSDFHLNAGSMWWGFPESVWRKIKKGDLLRLTLVATPDTLKPYVLRYRTSRRGGQTLGCKITDVRLLSSAEKEVVPAAREWFKSLQERFSEAGSR